MIIFFRNIITALILKVHKKRNFIQKAINFRYRLLPYLYSLAHDLYQNGKLIGRSLLMDFENTDNFSDSSYNLLWEYDISYQELSKEYVINNCDYIVFRSSH